jgi:hypothetical protein
MNTPTTSSLTTDLTEYMLGDILSESPEIKKVIGIYPGRFQPAGLHHYKTYKWFSKQFDDAWVATSDKTNTTDSPLDFRSKKMIWNKHGVRKISQVKNPYKAEEILKKYDPETTAAVFLVGKKDADRLKGKFFRTWKGKAELGYRDGAYLLLAPHVSIKVLGNEVNGTYIRELLGSNKYTNAQKVEAFEDLFGWYDERIFVYLKKKFSTLFENIEIFDNFLTEYPGMENFVDNIPTNILELSSVSGMGKPMVDDGPTGFFPGDSYEAHTKGRAEQLGYELLNYVAGKNTTPRNTDYRIWGDYSGPVPSVSFFPSGDIDEKTPTNQIEYENSQTAYTAWEKFIKSSAEVVGFKIVDFLGADMSIRKHDEQGDEDMDSKFVIDTETSEDSEDEIESGVKGDAVDESILIMEGGAAGHMSHPFDDRDLTFSDLKEMIRRSLSGELNVEKEVTEKLDGQNLMFSWKDGKLIAARNQGHLKNAGAAAPDVSAFKDFFANRDENIRDAFVNAVEDLESAISKLSDSQKTKIFHEGERFMNIEVMTPATQNVIPQNVDMLVFHGTQAYNSAGKPVDTDLDGNNITSELKDSARMLKGMLKQINADVQARYSLNAPIVVNLPKSKTFADSLAKYTTMIDKLKKEFKLKDNDKVMKYHDAWWRNLLDKQQSQKKEVFPSNVYEALIGRWAYNDKSNKITTIRMDLENQPKLKAWVNKFEKEDIVKQFEANMWPFQFIFLKLGAEVLQNVKGFVAAGGADDIAKALDAHTKTLESKKIGSVESPDKFKKDMEKLNKNLARLSAIGGTSAIAPTEGVVFQYKGGTYKLTGTFAPINQIMGIMRF